MNKSEGKKSEAEKEDNKKQNKFELVDKSKDKQSPYFLNINKIQYKSLFDIKEEIAQYKRNEDLSDKKNDISFYVNNTLISIPFMV